MSRLSKNIHFVKLILNPEVNNKQKRALIDFAHKEQVGVLLEIFHNLLHSDLPLDPRRKAYLDKRRSLLKRILNSENPNRSVYKYSKVVVEILNEFAEPLLELI